MSVDADAATSCRSWSRLSSKSVTSQSSSLCVENDFVPAELVRGVGIRLPVLGEVPLKVSTETKLKSCSFCCPMTSRGNSISHAINMLLLLFMNATFHFLTLFS